MRAILRLSTIAFAMSIGGIAAVYAADRPVSMKVPKPLAKDLAAFPQIADPADYAERKINTSVGRLDGVLRKAVAQCKTDAGGPGSFDWSRTIEVTMRGPRFLSYLVTDNSSCGGAHPNVDTMSIVYDLATGTPVDWTKLLPPSLTGKVELTTAADGSKIVTLASKRLYALYLAGYPKTEAAAQDKDCLDAVKGEGDTDPPAMMAWLDAKQPGLAVQFDLPHAVAVCAGPVTIGPDALKQDGAQQALVDALVGAHAGAAGAGK